jgi:hypothetical protein
MMFSFRERVAAAQYGCHCALMRASRDPAGALGASCAASRPR